MRCWLACLKRILMLLNICCEEGPLSARKSPVVPSLRDLSARPVILFVRYWDAKIFFFCFLCRESGILRPEDSFSLTESCMSSDSLKASSGEVSPYDNNSPVLSDRLLLNDTEHSSLNSDRDPICPRQYKLSDHSKDRSGSASPTLSADKGEQNVFYDMVVL